MVLTCSLVTIGVPLMWTTGVIGALQGGPNLNQGDTLAGSAYFVSGHMLQLGKSTAAPGPGTNKIDGVSKKSIYCNVDTCNFLCAGRQFLS